MPIISPDLNVPALSIVGIRVGATVTHVALLKSDTLPKSGHSYSVWHTGPPTGKFKVPIDVAGHLSDLSNDEAALLKSDITRVLKQVPRITEKEGNDERKRQILAHYTVIPPIRAVRDEVDNRFRYFRFSCAGFVAYCYEQSLEVRLVELSSLPMVDKAYVYQAYGDQLAGLTPEEVEELGLEQKQIRTITELGWSKTITEARTEWPILLPSYLITSLNRSDSDCRSVPFVPTSSDLQV